MKSILLCILACLISHVSVSGQSCAPDFKSQADIDNFHINYPGCKTIEGSLKLTSAVTNLNGLLGVEAINGSIIFENLDITSLHGLDSLVHIGNDTDKTISIKKCHKLINLIGLGKIKDNNFNLFLEQAAALKSLVGLPKLDSLGEVSISLNLPNLNDFLGYKYFSSFEVSISNIDFSGLDSLQSAGELIITACNSLESLKGLENLKYVDGNLRILANSKLTSIKELQSLTHVGSLGIEGCNHLKSMDGPIFMQDSLGFIILFYNDSLQDLSALKNIKKVGNFDIYGNNLSTLKGLEKLEIIESEFQIEGNTSLFDLIGLDNLTSCKGIRIANSSLSSCEGLNKLLKLKYLYLENNQNLSSLEAFALVDSLNTRLSIYECNKLSNLSGLNNVKHISEIYIEYNDELETLEALENIKWSNYISIYKNPSLINLEGLNGLELVNDEFNINTNISLTSLEALKNLQEVKNNFIILGNLKLSSLQGLNNLKKVGDAFNIGRNILLTDLMGLEQLDTVSGNMNISLNDKLGSFKGINSLKYIGNDFTIFGNKLIKSLEGLELINHFELLTINKNNELESIKGLADSIKLTGIDIKDNPKLTECDISLLCEHFLKFNPDIVSINTNAVKCNSKQEVQDQCLLSSVTEIPEVDKYIIYPNPGNGVYNISMPDDFKVKVLVTDNIGRVILTATDKAIDLSNEKGGIYYFQIIGEKYTLVKKVIKL